MKRICPSKPRLQVGVTLAVVAGAMYVASIPLVGAADAKTGKAAQTEKPGPSAKQKPKKPEKKRLTGADLYAIHCGRCHPERYASEFTPAQWKSVLTEMRVRANLPADQARLILKYLQEDSGTP